MQEGIMGPSRRRGTWREEKESDVVAETMTLLAIEKTTNKTEGEKKLEDNPHRVKKVRKKGIRKGKATG